MFLSTSRISIFVASFLTAFAAVTACSSSKDEGTPVPVAEKNPAQPGEKAGGNDGQKPNAPGGGTSPPAGGGDNPSACAATATAEECDTCCYEPHAAAVDAVYETIEACVCETTCATACASTCSPDGGAPTDACNACSKDCETKANAACQEDVGCGQYLKCTEDAQCEKKAKQ